MQVCSSLIEAKGRVFVMDMQGLRRGLPPPFASESKREELRGLYECGQRTGTLYQPVPEPISLRPRHYVLYRLRVRNARAQNTEVELGEFLEVNGCRFVGLFDDDAVNGREKDVRDGAVGREACDGRAGQFKDKGSSIRERWQAL